MAGRYDFTIEEGISDEKPITWSNSANVPYNVTGYTAKIQARTSGGSLVYDASTENEKILVEGEEGTFIWIVEENDFRNMPEKLLVYQLKVFSPSNRPYSLLRGKILIKREVVKNE